MATWLFIGTIFGVVLRLRSFVGAVAMFRCVTTKAVNPPKAAGAWMWRQQTHREWLMHGRLPFMAAGPDWVLCK